MTNSAPLWCVNGEKMTISSDPIYGSNAELFPGQKNGDTHNFVSESNYSSPSFSWAIPLPHISPWGSFFLLALLSFGLFFFRNKTNKPIPIETTRRFGRRWRRCRCRRRRWRRWRRWRRSLSDTSVSLFQDSRKIKIRTRANSSTSKSRTT